MSDDIRFNKFKKRLITLEEGESFCKKCRGKGVVSTKTKFRVRSPFSTKYYNLTCSKCFGDGKLDWIEQVTGKPKTTMEAQNDSYTPSH